MVTVPPRHYCTVANPVSRDPQGAVLFDVTGQVRLRHADLEIRLTQDPFPLYPGEVLEKVPDLASSVTMRPCLRALRGLRRDTSGGGERGRGGICWFSPKTDPCFLHLPLAPTLALL